MYTRRRQSRKSDREFSETVNQDWLAILSTEQRPDVTSRFPFMRLPPEIRNAIYHLHLVQPEDQTKLRRWNDGFSSRARAAARYRAEDPNHLSPSFDYTSLSILGVSHQIHEEALGIFYYYNTLQLQSVNTLRDFLSSIGSRRRAFIRDIQFHYCGTAPAAAFKLLGTCKNLTNLQIRTSYLTLSGDKRNLLEARGFGQLLKIRGLETVDVFHPPQYFPYSNKQRFKDAVRNALLQPRKAIKDRKRAANSQGAFERNNVVAGKKRTVEGGKTSRAKKTKLSQNGN